MKPVSFLIVENAPLTANQLKGIVEKLGYTVIGIANTGEKALRLFEEGIPDIVLMDIGLDGDMDGIQVAKEMKKRRSDLLLIFLTERIDAFQDTKELGPLNFLPKPIYDYNVEPAIELAAQRVDPDNDLDLPFSNLIVKSKSFWIKQNDGDRNPFIKIPKEDVCLVKSDNAYLEFYSVTNPNKKYIIVMQGNIFEGALNTFSKAYIKFRRANRSCIVNTDHIIKHTSKEVWVTCYPDPISVTRDMTSFP
jgi:DNA-binding LytR/AlgR family response regulator